MLAESQDAYGEREGGPQNEQNAQCVDYFTHRGEPLSTLSHGSRGNKTVPSSKGALTRDQPKKAETEG